MAGGDRGFNRGPRTGRAGSNGMATPDTSDTTPEPTGSPGEPDARGSRWKSVFRWGERVLTVGLLVFVFVRLGPQIGALTGVGPDLGRSPAYEIVTLEGERITSESLRGRVVVLNFWATWCGPCKLEMPSLQSLHEDRGKDGVVVIGLSTDVGNERGIRDYLSEREINFAVGRATRAHREAFGGIRGIPTTFIIDADGIVRHRVVGYFTPPALRLAVRRLLNENTPAPTGTEVSSR